MIGFAYNDGNNGSIELYQTIDEAVDAAEVMWDHLTENDKRRYTDKAQGAYFCVCEMDGEELGICIKDFTKEVRMNWREVIDTACNLYGGGWRSGDKDMLMTEYDLSEENADLICEALEDMEKEAA